MVKIYISMLRGINVGGQKKIKMADLEKVYTKLGFTGVKTYIQSGNVIFGSGTDKGAIEISRDIEQVIEKEFGFQVPVIIRTINEMMAVAVSNPFLKNKDNSGGKYYVTFLEKEPDPAYLARIRRGDFLPDRFIVSGREIYLDCAGGYGTTKLSNTFFENKLNVKATTRNWNTVNKLLELANEKSKSMTND